MTLAYAFWFSFSQLPLKISPDIWPMIWLGLATVVLINPLPIFYPYSRRWTLTKTARLFLSGFHQVEVRSAPKSQCV